MKKSPLFSGFIYLFLGLLFTYFAIQNVQDSGWGIFAILLVILATFDCGSGLKILLSSFLLKKNKQK
jgi:hypothetical protein